MSDQLLTTLLARQGIYNRSGLVVAYELLYRSLDNPSSCLVAGDEATSAVIVQLFASMDSNHIIGTKRAFINFTYNHLLQEVPLLLPKEQVTIEVLETVEIDDAILNALKFYREKGYTIALDDFIYNEKTASILDLADIIKVDVLNQNQQQIEEQLKPLKQFKGTLLAEKVETYEQFTICQDLGFDLFQGFYLNKPDPLKGHLVTENKNNLIQLLYELNNETISLERIEETIIQVPRLSYRILRLANSVFVYSGQKVNSLMDALKKLGLVQIRNWLSLLLLSSKDDIMCDLLERTLIRAKMCESLAITANFPDPHQAFTVGILSTIDSFLNEPMHILLERIRLHDTLNDALLDQRGKLGGLLRVTIEYEKANYNALEKTKYREQDLTRCYLEGIDYASSVMQAVFGTQ